MRAIVVRAYGPPEGMAIEDRPVPRPGPGEVLIDVHAIGVNFPDLLVIAGRYQVRPPLPFSPGKEVAGVVAAAGAGVTRLRPGDRVLAQLEHGGYAEAVAAREAHCAAVPAGTGLVEAVAMGLAYQTAHFALVERGRLRAGETVLVTGALGGVGLAAVQLARALGATVVAGVGRPAAADIARAAGADHVIDLGTADIRNAVRDEVQRVTGGRGADVAIDLVGGEALFACLRALAWHGRLVVVGFASGEIPAIPANYLLVRNVTVSGLQWSDYREREPDRVVAVQDEIFRLHAAAAVRPHVAAVYPMERFADALGALRARRVIGRVVLVTGRHAPRAPRRPA